MNRQSNRLTIKDLGIIDYASALETQKQLLAQRQDNKITDTVLLLEHPSVITFGVREEKNQLLKDENFLKKKSIDIVKVRRGGGATAHNPGQIVAYPILSLKSLDIGINEYIRTLEQIGIELLVEFAVSCGRKKGLPGLWVDEKKIASIGVKVHKWITYHGIAINIFNDLSIFDLIVPCGIENVKMTSVLELTGRKPNMQKVKDKLGELCGKYFVSKKHQEHPTK